MSLGKLIERFRRPDAGRRTMPQWSWNGELSRERITEQLEQFTRRGCGGVFPHARPGLITGYLSDEWFEMWGHGLREAERLGLEFHIYDEFCCPGGHAGGHVVARSPHLVQQVLALSIVTDPIARPKGEVLGWYRWDRANGSLARCPAEGVESASNEEPVLALVMLSGQHRPARGEFAMPDMLRRETAETFIETTHARYAERFAEHFGSTCRYVFCDEPHIFGSRDGWPLSAHLLREFRREHGYELAGRLGELCFGLKGAEGVRFDYWSTVNRLYNHSFMRTLHDWCAEHGLLLTGHIMEHTWPSPRLNPDVMAALRWMQAPGNDLLGFQFSATGPADNGLYLLNAKQVSSVAAQLGRGRIVTEACGGAGYDAAFDVFKPLEDYLLALGVNVMDPHLCHQTLSGARKYDWPQTLSDHSPWWDYYRPHAEHVARANAALDRGVERNRVLVLEPTTSAWLRYAPEPFRLGADDPLDDIERSQVGLVTGLYGAQVDFDLGDEFIMEELGRAEDGRLTVGERSYELVVMPEAMENWTASTLELLRAYLAGSGRVVSGAEAPRYVNGRPSAEPAELWREHADRWQRCETPEALVEAVRGAVPPWLAAPGGAPLPDGLVWRRVAVADGALLYFLCNPWPETLKAEVRLEKPILTELDTRTGKVVASKTTGGDEEAVAELSLRHGGHVLWLNTDAPVAEARPPRTEPARAVELGPPAIERLADNVLVVDYCDLEADGQRFDDVGTVRADRLNWRAQGFEQNPWSGAHQFNRTVIDRPVPADSGFSVTYRFELSEDLPEEARRSLRIGVERLWLYAAEMNGEPLGIGAAEPWFDEQARALAVGEHVRPGVNALRLAARPFHMLCETMPVYLLGAFGLEPAERGFRVGPEQLLELGDWTAQGMPFYHDAVRYRFPFELAGPATALRVLLPRWSGSVVALRLDGEERGIVYPHDTSADVLGELAAGPHELDLDVVGNMRNLIGPHHAEGLPGAWTWVQCPKHMPPGSEYRLQPSGLTSPPELRAG